MTTDHDPTIYSVAKEAEVSISTVSRVLNSPDLVKQETRDKVLAVIDRLDFVPKAAAQAQAKKQIGRIGVLAPFFTHPSFVQRMRGVYSVLATNSYELVIYPVTSMKQAHHYLETLPVTRRLDGLITMALALDERIANRYKKNRFPVVLIEFSHEGFSSVLIDNAAGGRMAAAYLIEKGHRKFGFVGDGGLLDYSIQPGKERHSGFEEELHNAGYEMLDEHVIFPAPDRALTELRGLLNHPQRPTAIFASTDELAMQLMSVVRQFGLRIPQDIAVIGFDDLDFAKHIGLTTISQKLDESGKIAAEQLMGFLNGRDRSAKSIELELEIIERETV